LSPLKKDAATELNAHNGFARAMWYRDVARRLCKHLNACPPDRTQRTPVYHLTIVSRLDVVWDEGDVPFEVSAEKLAEMKRRFGIQLGGLNYVGMIDAGLTVSTQKVFQVPRFITLHGHFLVWGADEDLIDAICGDISKVTRAVLPYSMAAKPRKIRDGDLLQVTTGSAARAPCAWRR
jgi:hypothetical protein